MFKYALLFLVLTFNSGLCIAEKTDSLVNILATQNIEDTNRVNLLNKLSTDYLYINIDSSLILAEQSILLAQKISFKRGEGIAYKKLGNAYFYKGDPETAISSLEIAEEIMLGLNDYRNAAAIKQDIASVYQATGRLTEATAMFIEVCETYKALGEAMSLAGALNSLGMNYSYCDQYDEALRYLLMSMRIFEMHNNSYLKAVVLTNLANLYLKLEKFDYAERSALAAREIFISENNKYAEATVESILGSVMQLTGNFPESFQHYERSIELSEEVNDKYGLAKRLINAGSAYLQFGDHARALSFYNRGLLLSDFISSTREYGDGLCNMSHLYYELGKIDSAIYFGQQSLKILKEQVSPLSRYNLYLALSKAYAESGDFESAYFFQKEQLILKDSILDAQKLSAIEEWETKYQTEKKLAEISNLKAQKQLIDEESKRNLIVLWAVTGVSILLLILILLIIYASRIRHRHKQAELEQRALRAQMNPHFIFNSLNSIQRMYVEGENDKANDYTADFAELMRKILDNSDKNRISLQEEIRTLKLYLQLEKLRCKDQIDYEINVQEDIDVSEIQVPPLVFQPFVENAIWHGILPQKKQGKISISISKKGELLKCLVTDDGAGISAEKKSTYESKGIHITEQRIGSKVEIESSPGNGTKVTFYLSL